MRFTLVLASIWVLLYPSLAAAQTELEPTVITAPVPTAAPTRIIIGFNRREVPYDGGTVPPMARVRNHRPLAVIIGGGGAFLLAYGASTAVNEILSISCAFRSSASCHSSLWMAIPLVGPWGALSDHFSTEINVFLVIDGIIQVGGIALAVIGLFLPPRRTLLFSEPIYARHQRTPTTWTVMPTASRDFAGLRALVTF